jgi:hypothetical protein
MKILNSTDLIHDSDDPGVDCRLGRMEGEARFSAADEEYFLSDAGADGIDGHQRAAGWLTRRGQRLDDKQLEPDQILVFSSDDDVADDTRQLH